MSRLRPAICAGLCLFAGAGAAQTDGENRGGLTRVLELRAHQALIEQSHRAEVTLAPFETDGCSGGLSDIWRLVSGQFPDFAAAHQEIPPWEYCCVEHDRTYHDGGGADTAEASYSARVQADDALRSCVMQTGETRKQQVATHYEVEPDSVTRAYGVIADAMHLAVRFGGAPCSGLPWRWGFGWPECSVLQLSTQE